MSRTNPARDTNVAPPCSLKSAPAKCARKCARAVRQKQKSPPVMRALEYKQLVSCSQFKFQKQRGADFPNRVRLVRSPVLPVARSRVELGKACERMVSACFGEARRKWQGAMSAHFTASKLCGSNPAPTISAFCFLLFALCPSPFAPLFAAPRRPCGDSLLATISAFLTPAPCSVSMHSQQGARRKLQKKKRRDRRKTVS